MRLQTGKIVLKYIENFVRREREAVNRFRDFLSDVVRQSDMVLLSLCTVSTLYGMVLIASATHFRNTFKYVAIQGFGLLLGVLLYFLLSSIDVSEVGKKWKWLLAFNFGFILLLRTPFGLTRNGNRAWLGVNAIGTDAFQEADIVGATYPVVKHSYLVTRAQDIPRVLAEAHYVARSGRPGPVVVDITKTAQIGDMYYSWPQRMILPGYNPTTKAHGRVLSDAAKLFEQAYRPVLYVGGGAARSDAGKLVQELAEVTNAPIVTTLPARGVVPDSDPKVLGMLGMHGTIAATGAVQRCDLLVAIGARFDDRVTGKLDAFAPGARVIHIDIDPAEIGKNRQPDVPIVGDVATVLKDLIPEIKREQAVHGKPDTSHWWEIINDWREKYPIKWDEPTDGSLAPQWVIKQLSDLADPDTIWVTGVGQHQMWATQLIDFEKPHSWLSSGGLGTMGYGLPAAIGARVGSERFHEGEKPVWLIDGDGSFQMTSEELAAAFHDHTPVKIALLNNSVYGMVRQWQTLFYGEHYSATNLMDGENTPEIVDVPDFVKLAEAYGCVGMRAFTEEEAVEAIKKANEINDRPVLIDFRVWKDAMVWPMVAAGDSNDNVTYMPGIKPLQRPKAAADNE